MQAHRQRVLVERDALQDKIIALDAFIDGTVFITLPIREQELMRAQLHVMNAYAQILSVRIILWS